MSEVEEMFLTTLSKEQCDKIHAGALRILGETGVIFQSAEARDIFKKAGARVEGEKVFLSESLVKWALQCVPDSFTVYDQKGEAKLEAGGRNCYYGPGSDCLRIIDHRTGQRREPVLNDVVELVKMCDSLDNIDFLMSMVVPTDCQPEIADRAQMEIMLSHSTKPIIGVSFSYEGTRDTIAMAEKVAGGQENLRKNPFLVHYMQPVKALVHNEDSVNKLMYTAKKGLPCLYLVSGVMGVTCPITPAGYQVAGAAGQLAALVLIQLIREGTPFVVRGGRIVVVDMRSMLFTIASPENRIFSSDMAHYYNLPCFGTAGCSDAKKVDWQTVSEASLTLMADSLVGANLIHDIGYIESGATYSGEMLVLCNEIISWIRAFKRGAPINDETMGLDLIHEIGFSDDFLTSEHTLEHYSYQ